MTPLQLVPWDGTLTGLRNVLAALYPKENDARMVADQAGVPSEFVIFSGAAMVTWHNLLRIAFYLGKVRAILDVAQARYPKNETLQAAAQAYHLRHPVEVVHGDVPALVAEIEGRGAEFAYLIRLIDEYREFEATYTPLAGVVERQIVEPEARQLKMSSRFMPTAFEKLVEHGYGPARRTERVPVDDIRAAVVEHRRLVLLGEPGSGKTTTLRRLAYDFAVAALADPQAPVPLLVPLGGYSGPEPAQAYVQGYFGELGPSLYGYLQSNRVMLLLDGLNEMPQRDYAERVGRIQALLDQHRDAMVVVTCRELDYVEKLRLQKLEIKLLNVERQHAYLHRYLDPSEAEKLFWLLGGEEVTALWAVWQEAGGTWQEFLAADRMAGLSIRYRTSEQRQLWRRLKSGWLPPLWALGQNPFMLVMLAQVYVSEGSLPQNRGKLFAAFVDTLLERERTRPGQEAWPGNERIMRSLARLAYVMQEAGERGTAVERAWAVEQLGDGIDPERLLYLAASATLLDTSGEKVRFVHQLIQEYFAALALEGQLAAAEDLGRYWPKGWVPPSGWEETTILLAGIVPDMAPLLKQLLVANPPLAARCLADSGGKTPKEPDVPSVQQVLVNSMQDPRIEMCQRDAAGVALNLHGDRRPGVSLRPDGLPDIDWVLVPDHDPKTGRREFIYQEDERRTEPDFWMARYPITYRQFQAFLDAPDGFRNAPWWEGLAASQEHRSRWGEQAFKYWNHPRERVSWYDAIAFCCWLTAQAQAHPVLLPEALRGQKGWRITLPTEWQWEKAARGHDGRRYPWGGTGYQLGHANINETWGAVGLHYLEKTTAVGMYLHGASPYGIQDISGNVWEWCLNEYGSPERIQLEGSANRVLRGGSWGSNRYLAASSYRNLGLGWPDARDGYCGVRVVASLTPAF